MTNFLGGLFTIPGQIGGASLNHRAKHSQEDEPKITQRDSDGIPIDPNYTPSEIPEHMIRDYKLSKGRR